MIYLRDHRGLMAGALGQGLGQGFANGMSYGLQDKWEEERYRKTFNNMFPMHQPPQDSSFGTATPNGGVEYTPEQFDAMARHYDTPVQGLLTNAMEGNPQLEMLFNAAQYDRNMYPSLMQAIAEQLKRERCISNAYFTR